MITFPDRCKRQIEYEHPEAVKTQIAMGWPVYREGKWILIESNDDLP